MSLVVDPVMVESRSSVAPSYTCTAPALAAPVKSNPGSAITTLPFARTTTFVAASVEPNVSLPVGPVMVLTVALEPNASASGTPGRPKVIVRIAHAKRARNLGVFMLYRLSKINR